jgi:tetratricopeptide (TPR) repeat protein
MWRSRPVFISSTFVDMQSERDYLRTHVFPELEERLRRRCHYLEWVDLRVGVASASQTEEHARELQVLKVCLAEVQRCRPFLIVLMADRYGWVPPAERIKAAATEEGFDTDVAGRSVTDLEIEFGVLSDPEQQHRSFFYIRDPLPYAQMPPSIAAMYADTCATDADAPDRIKRLTELKRRIETALPDRVRHYRAGWDGERQRVTDLEGWGQIVLEDLWAELEAETAATADESEISWQQAERNALEDFADERARDFVGRHEILAALTDFACAPFEGNEVWGLCVTGESGSGTSTLFRALYRQLKQTNAFVLAHASRASQRSASVDHMLRRWIDELAVALAIDPRLAADANPETVDAMFATLLARMAGQRRVVVLVDALHRFEATTRGRYATWLPRLWPANARLLATAIPGEATRILAERPGIGLVQLRPLDRGEARAIAEAICARYHRTLEPQVLEALLAKSEDGAVAWEKPLWLMLAVEELNLLDADDFERVKRAYSGAPAERLRALMLEIVASLPADIPGLYRASFDRAEELFGAGLARAFLGLIAVSRAGWRESDFRQLLPRASAVSWDGLRFAALRRLFRGQMRQREALGQWDFSYDQMRSAATLRLEPLRAAELHGMIADHLLALSPDDPLRQSETMVHLIGCANWMRSGAYYGDSSLSEAEAEAATQALTDHVLRAAEASAARALEDLSRLLDQRELHISTQAVVAKRMLYLLLGNLSGRASCDLRIEISHRIQRAFERLLRLMPGHCGWLSDLANCELTLGDQLAASGRREDALAAFARALGSYQLLVAADQENALWQQGLTMSLRSIGEVLFESGKRDEALAYYRWSLAIEEKLAATKPLDAGRQRSLVVTHTLIGTGLIASGKREEALAAYRASNEIASRLVIANPRDADLRDLLASSYDGIGEALADSGRGKEALAAFRQSLAIREELAAADPENVRYRNNLSIIHEQIGRHLLNVGEKEGVRASEASLAIRQKLAAGDPSDLHLQRNLANAYELLGDALVFVGRLEEALGAYQKDLAIMERLAAADPGNTHWIGGLAHCQHRIGNILGVLGRCDEALVAHEKSVAIRETLAAGDLGNAQSQQHLAASYLGIGDLLDDQNKTAEALVAYQKCLAIRERLVAADPSNAEWQQQLATCHNRLRLLFAATGKHEEALAAQRRAAIISEKLAAADPENRILQFNLALGLDEIGNVYIGTGKFDEALGQFRKAQEIFKQLVAADPTNFDWQNRLAHSHEKISEALKSAGRLEEAVSESRRGPALRETLAAADPSSVHAIGRSDDAQAAPAEPGEIGAKLSTPAAPPASPHLSDGSAVKADLAPGCEQSGDAALDPYRHAVAIAEKRAATNPGTRDFERELAVAYSCLGDVLRSLGRRAEALAAHQKSLSIRERLAANSAEVEQAK